MNTIFIFIFINLLILWILFIFVTPRKFEIYPDPPANNLYLTDTQRVKVLEASALFQGNIQFNSSTSLTFTLDIVRNVYSVLYYYPFGKSFECNFVNVGTGTITIQNKSNYKNGSVVSVNDQWRIVNGTGNTIVIAGNTNQLVEFVFNYDTQASVFGTAYVIL